MGHSGLQYIATDYNILDYITTVHVFALFQSLAVATVLYVYYLQVNLEDCLLKEDGIKSILLGLCGNNSVQTLSLKGNGIQGSGTHALAKMLRHNSTLVRFASPVVQRYFNMIVTGTVLVLVGWILVVWNIKYGTVYSNMTVKVLVICMYPLKLSIGRLLTNVFFMLIVYAVQDIILKFEFSVTG